MLSIFKEEGRFLMLFKQIPEGVVFCVKLTPKASSNSIKNVETDPQGQPYLKVYVTAVPENNKANQALIQLLSKTLKLPKSSFEILSGITDRLKKILIRDAVISDVPLILRSLK